MGVQSGPRGRAFAPPSFAASGRGGPGHADLNVLPPLSRTVCPRGVTDRVSAGLIGFVLAETAPPRPRRRYGRPRERAHGARPTWRPYARQSYASEREPIPRPAASSPMKRLPSLLTLVIAPPGLRLPRLARAAAIPFAHETSDLQPDPPSVSARLPAASALRSSPSRRPRRASRRLLVEAGVFHEQDDPRGPAHFREHLAFDGNQNYQPGSLVELLQRLGMKFVADILREKRTRDSIQARVSDARMAFAFATTFFPKRLPIGLAEIISTAPPSASSISGTPGIAPSTWPSSSWATSPSPSSRN